MASINGIFQPITPSGTTHAQEIQSVLAYDKKIILASAFINENGVGCLFDTLKQKGEKVSFYAGIRNNITSVQALSKILEAGCKLHVIDAGSPSRIFHGKIYVGSNDKSAKVIIGSANSTFSGLNNNLEIGANIDLDLSEKKDAEYLNSIHGYFESLGADHPANCYEVKNYAECVGLLSDGLVVDEEKVSKTPVIRGSSKSKTIKTNPMNIPFVAPPKREQPKASTKKKTVKILKPAPKPAILPGQLLWTKEKLSKRDMQLVQGNASGNVCLTQAKFRVDGELIEWTTYFRNVVFASLPWKNEKDKETTAATFSLVVDGIDYGIYKLAISHKPSWESDQRNYTTAIHWGETKSLINKEELVGKQLHLYECDSKAADYVLEITD